MGMERGRQREGERVRTSFEPLKKIILQFISIQGTYNCMSQRSALIPTLLPLLLLDLALACIL